MSFWDDPQGIEVRHDEENDHHNNNHVNDDDNGRDESKSVGGGIVDFDEEPSVSVDANPPDRRGSNHRERSNTNVPGPHVVTIEGEEAASAWILPEIRRPKTNTKIFSKYKTVAVDPNTNFALQRVKALGTTLQSLGKGGDKTEECTCRIVSATEGPFYEVARRNNYHLLLTQEWAYIIHELPLMCPPFNSAQEKDKWLLTHFEMLAHTTASSQGAGPIDPAADSDDDVDVVEPSQRGGVAGDVAPATLVSLPQSRRGFIKHQLRLRIKDYSEARPISVFCGTWNLNGKKPKEDITPWLFPPSSKSLGSGADVYAISFQEIVDLNASSFLMEHTASRAWEDMIEKILNKETGKKYSLVKQVQLVGLSLCVYARSDMLRAITDVQADQVGVGLMGVGGNKGAVCVRFDVFDSSIAFVNSHLAAHQGAVKQRNADYKAICKRAAFMNPRTMTKTRTLFNHDTVFWIGDLNYRLELEDIGYVHKRIEVKDWQFLLQHDQLNLEKEAGRAFGPFLEGPVTFGPTYKFIPGTNDYEQREEKKIRLPSWCDRIQWLGEDVQQKYYCRSELLLSDHKPVAALFAVQCRQVQVDQQQALMQVLAALPEEFTKPQVSLSTTAITISQLLYGEPHHSTITITNTSRIYVEVCAPTHKELPPWLAVAPQRVVIPPSGKAEVVVEVVVSSPLAYKIASLSLSLAHSLTFKVVDGPEATVAVKAQYAPSCFGTSLSALCRLGQSVAIRGLQSVDFQSVEEAQIASVIPPQMFKMTEYILSQIKRASTTKKIILSFQLLHHPSLQHPLQTSSSSSSSSVVINSPGRRLSAILTGSPLKTTLSLSDNNDYEAMRNVREMLDNNIDFEAKDQKMKMVVGGVCDALLAFVNALHEPLFDPEAINVAFCEGATTMDAWCKQALATLPLLNYHFLIYILSFFRHLIALSITPPTVVVLEQNVDQLADLLAQVCTKRSKSSLSFNKYSHKSPLAIFTHFLTQSC